MQNICCHKTVKKIFYRMEKSRLSVKVYEQLVRQNALQEELCHFVLFLVSLGSVETQLRSSCKFSNSSVDRSLLFPKGTEITRTGQEN